MIYVHIFYDILCSYNTVYVFLCLKNYDFFRFLGVLDLGVPRKNHPCYCRIFPYKPSSQGGYRRDSAILGDIKADGGAKKTPEKPRDLPSGYD
jgi:hypothetical protein